MMRLPGLLFHSAIKASSGAVSFGVSGGFAVALTVGSSAIEISITQEVWEGKAKERQKM